MTLAVMALYAEGTTRLNNIASWRVKETDRISAMATELRKLGAQVEEGADFIAVTPPAPDQWRSAAIHTYDDHRMAMCFSLAAFNPLAGAQPPRELRILDPRCVAKTFPDYFEALFGVAQAAREEVPVITLDGPTASGKGTLAAAVARRLGYHLLDSGALYAPWAWPPRRMAWPPTTAPAWPALPRYWTCVSKPGRCSCAGRRSPKRCAPKKPAPWRRRCPPMPRCARRCSAADGLSPRPGAGGRRARHGHRHLPGAALKVFVTASAARRAKGGMRN